MSGVPDGTPCTRCGCVTERQRLAALACARCGRATHAACTSPPGGLSGDIFYEFTCAVCAPAGRDTFRRPPLHWVNILILVTNQLNVTSYPLSKQGFFHYKTHIANFVDRHWTLLFGKCKKRKKWSDIVAKVLSHFSGTIFESGFQVLGEPGWWRLLHRFSPATAMHIVQGLSQNNHENKAQMILDGKGSDKSNFLKIVVRLGYEHLLSNDNTDVAQSEEYVTNKKRKIDSECSGISSTYSDNNQDSDSRYEADEKMSGDLILDQESEYFALKSIKPIGDNLVNFSASYPYQASSSALYDSDSRSRSPMTNYMGQSEESDHKNTECEDKLRAKEPKEKPQIEPKKTSLFSEQPNSVGELPWLKPLNEAKDASLVRLNEYEEIQLLRRVESLIPDSRNAVDKAHLRRLRAKLAMRRLKRNKHLPLFDFDQTVKYLAGYSTLDPRYNTVSSERVLDRFQTSYHVDNPSRAALSSLQSTILVGRSDPAPFQSPYSGSMLKPFIRRDSESSPLWLRVMDELLLKTNKHNPDYVPRSRASIDYSYVRPQHIAAVNNLCAQFFWPGVDLMEVMQYPEFSCVVTYKKLVIGFAFLVPDVGFNQAYISFLLTRPEWRNAKIATFMLYHLLQTCAGKDVLIHVSPTNPAVFLYQKFGFKVEELIQDFYEKYFEITSKECRHALLLRLTR